MRWVLAALIVTLAATIPIVARTIPASAQTPEAGRNQIVTTGAGRTEIAPDQATLHAGAQAQRPTAAEAAAEVNRIATQVLARLQALGVRSEDVRTSAVQVFPVYSQARDGAAPQITGYRATYMLTITLTNLALVGRAIDAAVEGGANMIQGITFGLRNPSRARNQALAAAVRDAREKSEAIAQAAGLRISGIERITEEGASVQPREMRMAAGAQVATPIEPGTVIVAAQVTVVFRY